MEAFMLRTACLSSATENRLLCTPLTIDGELFCSAEKKHPSEKLAVPSPASFPLARTNYSIGFEELFATAGHTHDHH